MIYVILVIIISGVVGGLTNYLTDLKDSETEKKDSKGIVSLFHNVLRSTIASFVVPLFLNTISSNLVSLLYDNPFKPEMLIFAGFCLLASLYSQYFLSGMFSKMMEKIKEVDNKANEKIKEVDEKVDELESQSRDNGELEPEPGEIKTILESIKDLVLSAKEKETAEKILELLTDGKYHSRSIKGITRALKKLKEPTIGEIKEEIIQEIIHKLYNKKVILQVNSKDLTEWWRINPQILSSVKSNT